MLETPGRAGAAAGAGASTTRFTLKPRYWAFACNDPLELWCVEGAAGRRYFADQAEARYWVRRLNRGAADFDADHDFEDRIQGPF